MTTGTMGTSFPCKPGTRLWRYPGSREGTRQSTEVTVWNKALIDDAEIDYRWRILSQPGYKEYYESMFDGEKQHYIDKSAVPAADLARVKAQATVLMMHGRQDVSFPPEDTCLVLGRSLHADIWLDRPLRSQRGARVSGEVPRRRPTALRGLEGSDRGRLREGVGPVTGRA